MGVFDKITGQKRAAAILQRMIRADRISHAWLFSGPSMASLQELALAFAQTLQCTQRKAGEADACMTCRSCRQAMDRNHPDIRVWTHEKPTTFSVDEARALISDISIRPYESERKIYIIPDAHLMRQEAQNALLKTLEEPPSYIVIILLTNSTDAMLETIRSRCQPLELAEGNIQYSQELCQTAESILLNIHSWEMYRINIAIKELADSKTQIPQLLELLTSWYRDILYFKASMDPDGILNHEHLSEIRTLAGQTSYEGIQNVLESIQKARRRLVANVNFDLTMELLLLAMKDAAS